MQAFREMIRGWFGKILLGVVIVLFVFAGAEALISVLNQPKPAVVVNGDEISQQDFTRGMEVQRRNMLSRMGENADPNSIDETFLRESVIETLINRSLMKQAVADAKLEISSEQLNAEIAQIPAFQVDGKFSQEQFERLVRQSGYGPKQFIQEVESDLVVGQLKDGLANSAFATGGELKRLIQIERQTRDISYISINHQNYIAGVELSDADIESFYKNNQGNYKTKEAVKAEYITVKVDDYLNDTEVTEDEIKTQFDVVIENLSKQEERKASHILVEINAKQDEAVAKEKIEQVKKKLTEGGDFAELAKEFSDDSGSKEAGGDLGFAGKGVFMPEFEKALFELSENQVSDIVKTEFGFHIIKLIEIKKPVLPTLEEKKEEIISQLKRDKAEKIYFEKIEDLKTLAFESGDIETVAEEFSKKVEQSDWIFKSGNPGVFSSDKLSAALFEEEILAGGANSDVLEVSATESMVARVLEHKPESIKPIEEVKEEIKQALVVEKAAEKAESTGKEILAKLKEGASTADIEASYGVEWKVVTAVKRRSPELDFNIAQKAFKMSKPPENGKTIEGLKASNDYAVIILTAVKQGEYNLSESEEQQMKKFIANQQGQAEFNDFVRNKRSEASIEISKPKT